MNKKEVLRYAGVSKEDKVFSQYIDNAIKEYEGKEKFAVCYTTLPVLINGDEIDFSFFKVEIS